MLSQSQIDAFITDGFVRMGGAFPADVAASARAILWDAVGLSPHRPETWTQPVIRLGMFADPPFREAASAPPLIQAFDQLVGPGRWVPPVALGTFPVRFPSPADPGDAGWHVDVSFGTEHPDFLEWRANVRSRGRALLMLFLFSDVGEEDAPTRLRVGSHRAMARLLAPAGDEGLTLREMVAADFGGGGEPEALATGPAGTVYLCHPFLVHSAQPNRGTEPRFMAQPPLVPAVPFDLSPGQSHSPVEQAIVDAITSSASDKEPT